MLSVKGRLPLKLGFRQRLSFLIGHPPSKVVYHQGSFSVEGRLPASLSSIKVRLPSKVAFCQRLSSIKDHLSSKVVLSQRSSCVKGRLLSKVVFPQMQSSVKGHLSSKVVFRQRSSSIKVLYCNVLNFTVLYQSSYFPIHLAAVASSYINNYGIDCKDKHVTGAVNHTGARSFFLGVYHGVPMCPSLGWVRLCGQEIRGPKGPYARGKAPSLEHRASPKSGHPENRHVVTIPSFRQTLGK